MTRPRRENGIVTLELVLWFPFIMAVVLAAVYLGRWSLAQAASEGAAGAAARAGSLARSAPEARTDAERVARQSLADRGVDCVTVDVDTDARALANPVGTTAGVQVIVTCTVDRGSLVPGLPGRATITARAVSPVDTWRERR